jgi:spore germination cell wall hydrolase CwlJ-like protein
MKILLLALVLGLGTMGSVYATDKEVLCIIGEAEGEGYIGMLAVGEAIRNRGTLKGVYGCKAPRVVGRKYSNATLKIATKAWLDSKNTNTVKGATHWEGTAFKVPYWAKSMKVTATIGRQRFYK